MQRLLVPLCFLLGVSTFSIGCGDKGIQLPDFGTETPEGEASTDPAPPTDPGTPPPPKPPTPPKPVPPTPEELIADFQKLKSHEITDTALARVTSQPESAAMIKELDVSSREFTVGGIEAAAKMPNLATLKIANVMLKPDHLKQLSKVTSLKTLHISGSQTDDTVIQNLTALPELEALDVSGTKITPASGTALSQMKKLRTVDLRSTQADDSTVSALAGHDILSIDLAKTRVTNASLPLLVKMPNLEELDVSFTQVTGPGFKGFGRTGIKVLNVSETGFGLEGFVNIKGMKALEELNIYRAGLVEHRSANVFKTFPKLRILNAGSNSITDAGMNVFFKGHRSLEVLKLGHNRNITDNGLAALVAVKTLKQLELQGTKCGPNGAKALKQRLPECKIATPNGVF